jgi:hypothetical protein
MEGGMKVDIVALAVDPQTLARIDAYAKKAGVDRHEAARRLIDLGLAEKQLSLGPPR